MNQSETDPISELQRNLAICLPDGIHAHLSREHHEDFVLHELEQQSCGRFSSKRLRDFVLGRYNAVQALQMLGVSRQPIAMGSSREPLWPSGSIGSISHSEGLAGAIVASTGQYSGLGLDIERGQDLDNIADHFCTDWELEQCRAQQRQTDHLNVVFGAKEAIYKCIWPTVRRFISFKDVQVAIDSSCNRFHVQWQNSVHPDLDRLAGFWVSAHGYTAVVAILKRIENSSQTREEYLT